MEVFYWSWRRFNAVRHLIDAKCSISKCTKQYQYSILKCNWVHSFMENTGLDVTALLLSQRLRCSRNDAVPRNGTVCSYGARRKCSRSCGCRLSCTCLPSRRPMGASQRVFEVGLSFSLFLPCRTVRMRSCNLASHHTLFIAKKDSNA